MCGHEYERLALRFAASKDGALAQEAGSCAMRHLVESCYLRHGDKFWGMEANKLWRTCTKKMRARQKSLVRRGNSALGTLLTREIYKCARRLAPERPLRREVGLRTVGDPGWGCLAQIFHACRSAAEQHNPCWTGAGSSQDENIKKPGPVPTRYNTSRDDLSHHGNAQNYRKQGQVFDFGMEDSRPVVELLEKEWHKVSEPSESVQLELQSESKCVELQPSQQALLTNAHEVGIRRFREAKYQPFKITPSGEICKLQSLWRATIARHMCSAALKDRCSLRVAITATQTKFLYEYTTKCCQTTSLSNFRATRTLQQLRRDKKARELKSPRCQVTATLCPQISLGGATRTKASRLMRARKTDGNLRAALAASDTTIIRMQDELNLLHATHTVVLDEVHNLVKATRSLSAIIANGAIFSATAYNFTPARDALKSNEPNVALPILRKLKVLSERHIGCCLKMVQVGMPFALVRLLGQADDARALLSFEILENLAKWQISAIADTGVVIALTRTLLLSVTPEVKDQAARTLALFQPTEYFQSGFRCAISNTNTGILLVDKLFLKRAGIHEAFLAKID